MTKQLIPILNKQIDISKEGEYNFKYKHNFKGTHDISMAMKRIQTLLPRDLYDKENFQGRLSVKLLDSRHNIVIDKIIDSSNILGKWGGEKGIGFWLAEYNFKGRKSDEYKLELKILSPDKRLTDTTPSIEVVALTECGMVLAAYVVLAIIFAFFGTVSLILGFVKK